MLKNMFVADFCIRNKNVGFEFLEKFVTYFPETRGEGGSKVVRRISENSSSFGETRFPKFCKFISHWVPKQMFFYTLCKRPLTLPPPSVLHNHVVDFLTVKKCINVCRDKIQHNSAKICGRNNFNKCVTILPLKINFCVNFRL